MDADAIKSLVIRTLPPTSSIDFAAKVRLFAFDTFTKQWTYTGLSGTVTLLHDSALKASLIRLYDAYNLSPLFETEIYRGFAGRLLRANPHFLYFPMQCGTVGLSFPSSTDADGLVAAVRKTTDSIETIHEVVETRPRKHTFATNLSQSSSNGMWDTRRESFNITQVPGELKRVFRKAGIKKTELTKPETAVAILEGLVEDQVDTLLQDDKPQEEEQPPDAEDFDAVIDQKISQISRHRKQTIYDTQSQIMHNIESGHVHHPTSHLSKKEEEQRLAQLLARKIEERRQQLHIYDSSGDSSSESEWSGDSSSEEDSDD